MHKKWGRVMNETHIFSGARNSGEPPTRSFKTETKSLSLASWLAQSAAVVLALPVDKGADSR